MNPQPGSGQQASNAGVPPARGEGILPSHDTANQDFPPATAHERADRRLDFRWTGANLRAMLVLCLLSAAALAARAAGRFELGGRPAVDARRVQAAAERVNPNTASAASLRRLPKIGPEHLRGILDYRAAYSAGGGEPAFRDANDLMRVRGIGLLTLHAFRDYLEFPPAR